MDLRLRCGRLLRLAVEDCVCGGGGFAILLLLAFAPRGGLFVGLVEDYASNALEFGAHVEHALDAIVFLVGAEEAQEAHDVVHQLNIRACPAVLRIL